MKHKASNLKFHLVILLMTVITFTSCKDENIGDYILTGNIESLIPENSWKIKQTNTSDGKYILFTPDLNSNFEYWGLSLKKVEYYIDGSFYKTETSRPFELMINKENFSIGMHNIKVV